MKLIWEDCQCGHKSCNLSYPTNFGSFYQGTGFNPDERELLDKLFTERHITMWRKPEAVLDWDFHVAEDHAEASNVIRNLQSQGVRQFATHLLGHKVEDLSSEY